MRITEQELMQEGINLKRWLGAIQRTAKEEDKIFAINGPMQRQVRRRSSKPGGPLVKSGQHSFMGGEKFRIGGISTEEKVMDRSIEITVTLVPADLALAGQISGMSMTLQDCFACLEGFEDWVGSFDEWRHLPSSTPRVKPKSLNEERSANPMWGAW